MQPILLLFVAFLASVVLGKTEQFHLRVAGVVDVARGEPVGGTALESSSSRAGADGAEVAAGTISSRLEAPICEQHGGHTAGPRATEIDRANPLHGADLFSALLRRHGFPNIELNHWIAPVVATSSAFLNEPKRLR